MPVSDLHMPTVTVLMPAYNYGHYVGGALQSALDQDYPPERLRVVVVDDGSTDDTAEVVGRFAVSCPERVTLIRQRNCGPSAAINRALGEADGDLIAVLDADDVWLPQKTRRQAELLAADPQLGMVFSDLLVIDGEGRTVRPSQVGNIGTFPRRAFAALLRQNVATQSSIMLRRVLASPLPEGVPYSDWWFALCGAQAGPVHYLPEQLALYREHGDNLTSGVSGNAAVREHRKEVAFQLWALRNLDLASLLPAETVAVWGGVEEHARRAVIAAQSLFVTFAQVADEDRAQARELSAAADAARQQGDSQRECQLLLSALAADPFAEEGRERLLGTVRRASSLLVTT